jgi:hypothetical protein
MKPEKRYLGDGVYAEFDGYAIILTVEDGETILSQIVVDPHVYTRLEQFVGQLRKARQGGAEKWWQVGEEGTI